MSGKKTDLTTKDKPVKPEESAKKSTKTKAKSAEKPSEKSAGAAKSAKSAVEKKAPAAKTAAKDSAKKASTAAKSGTKKSADEKTAAAKSTKTGAKKAPAKTMDAKSEKKPAAKKSADTAEKKPTKPRQKAEPNQEELKTGEPSSKTPQVMKLVQQRNDMVNPTIMAGKSSIPRQLRGLEPLSRIMKREADEVFGGDEAETYNLTALVIDEHAAEILRRFNACDCELCVETLARLTSEIVPARFVKLRKRDVERGAPEVKQLKEPLQKTITSRMVRLVMQNKKRSYHD